ncbi:hypothetical protein ACET3Z_017746 [Daucus carota]
MQLSEKLNYWFLIHHIEVNHKMLEIPFMVNRKVNWLLLNPCLSNVILAYRVTVICVPCFWVVFMPTDQ